MRLQITQLIDLTDGAYDSHQMKAMERRLLVVAGFDTTRPEPTWFARLLADWTGVRTLQAGQGRLVALETVLIYLTCLVAHQPVLYRRFLPSQVAVAALYLAEACEPTVTVPAGLNEVLGVDLHSPTAVEDCTALMAAMFLEAKEVAAVSEYCRFS